MEPKQPSHRKNPVVRYPFIRIIIDLHCMTQVIIEPYNSDLADDFKRISYHWIEKYFGVEDEDRRLLENHNEEIIDKGGTILFARYQGQIVGTCALIKYSDELFELAKMGVMEEFQGLKIGRKLAEAILDKARESGAKKVFLESSQQLTAALALYRKLGFTPDPTLKVSPYSRCNVQLALTL